MAFTEDLSIFFADFAVTVTAGGVGVPAIFDRDHIETMGGFGGGIDASVPVLLMQTADVIARGIAFGSEVTLPASSPWGAATCTVRNVRPDGTGLSMLLLELT